MRGDAHSDRAQASPLPSSCKPPAVAPDGNMQKPNFAYLPRPDQRMIPYRELDSRKYFWAKLKNTWLHFPALWNIIIVESDHDRLLAPRKVRRSRVGQKLLFMWLRIVWFWPRLVEAENWADVAFGRQSRPDRFVDMNESNLLLVEEVMARTNCASDDILDLGCNVGRHLAWLARSGCTHLHGVDISSDAVSAKDRLFPELNNTTISLDTIQRYLRRQKANSFEIVFTHGATVELIHPSFPLIAEITRVARRFVVMMINENTHSYPRFWEYEFLRNGFVTVKVLRPAGQTFETKDRRGQMTLFVFQRVDGVGDLSHEPDHMKPGSLLKESSTQT